MSSLHFLWYLKENISDNQELFESGIGWQCWKKCSPLQGCKGFNIKDQLCVYVRFLHCSSIKCRNSRVGWAQRPFCIRIFRTQMKITRSQWVCNFSIMSSLHFLWYLKENISDNQELFESGIGWQCWKKCSPLQGCKGFNIKDQLCVYVRFLHCSSIKCRNSRVGWAQRPFCIRIFRTQMKITRSQWKYSKQF